LKAGKTQARDAELLTNPRFSGGFVLAMFALSVESVFPVAGQVFQVRQACRREPETFLG